MDRTKFWMVLAAVAGILALVLAVLLFRRGPTRPLPSHAALVRRGRDGQWTPPLGVFPIMGAGDLAASTTAGMAAEYTGWGDSWAATAAMGEGASG